MNYQSSEIPSVASTPNIRGKSDPAWGHFSETRGPNRKTTYTCMYCAKFFKGGGINRMKYHLACIPEKISSCKSVPNEVRIEIRDYLKQGELKKKALKETLNDAFDDVEEEEVQIQEQEVSEDEEETYEQRSQKRAREQDKEKEKEKEKGKEKEKTIESTTSQPSIKSAFSSKSAKHRANIALAKWFYDACIPFNAINSSYFKSAVKAIAGIGADFGGPSYHDMRVNLLEECKKKLDFLINSYRSNLRDNGCTIMADGWTDQRQRTLINFLVYCPAGLVFVKSVDASDAVKDANTLFHMFSEVVEWVGPSNVVHMVTDNAAAYKLAVSKLHEKYSNIYWSPCAAHCLNLILKDICSMSHASSLASRASHVTKFVYNHGVILSWLRKFDGWKEIVRPGITRFSTTFITLQSLCEHRYNLTSLVSSKFFMEHKLSETTQGRLASTIVLDRKFWDDCLMIVKVVTPIVKFLRIVDSDEKPSLGYVYEGIIYFIIIS